MREYVVREGDSPTSIAIFYAGCPRCARDLVKSNPHKRAVVLPNGFTTFDEMRPGEKLNLPDKWFSPRFDALPKTYFAALPHHDGQSPSTLGGYAAGVLGDFAALDEATSKIEGLPGVLDSNFVNAVTDASNVLARSVDEVIKSQNGVAIASALEARATAEAAKLTAFTLPVAIESGQTQVVNTGRQQIQNILGVGLDKAYASLNAFYSAPTLPSPPPLPSVPLPPIPVSTGGGIPEALKALVNVDPCAASSAIAVCAAQTILGISPDGKYGDTTAKAAKKIYPGAPAGCNPRPAWWAPTGQKNCGTVTPPEEQVTPPVAAQQPKKMGVAGVIGWTVVGAALVGGALWLYENPQVIQEYAPASRRKTVRY